MLKFETGKTYSTRSLCDHEMIITATIVKRTAKTVVADVKHHGQKRFRLSEFDGREQFRPWGNFSMAPIIDASDEI